VKSERRYLRIRLTKMEKTKTVVDAHFSCTERTPLEMALDAGHIDTMA